MTDADLIHLVEDYFAGLDTRDPEVFERCLTEDCVLSIKTHDIVHSGRAAIEALFHARWAGPIRTRHHDFTHTPSSRDNRIASQFTVTYTGPSAPPPKSNANVTHVRDGRIARLDVYMAGENTIRS